ncbi:MAG: zinc-binding dehydrogenase, partial [Ornithinimicrobium sp.]
IGTMAIQLACALGVRVIVTAGSEEKLDACRDLGADVGINYREQDFVEETLSATDGAGVDVILDVVGAAYLDRNLQALATGGRLVIIGMQGGAKGELNIARLLGKRGRIIATGLRSRGVEDKAGIVAAVRERVWPLIEAGTIRPLVHETYPMDDAASAHRAMEGSQHIGKILLTR